MLVKNMVDSQTNKADLEKLPVRKLQGTCYFSPADRTELKTAVNAYIDDSASAIGT